MRVGEWILGRKVEAGRDEHTRSGAINTDGPLWIDIIHCVYYNSPRTWFCIRVCSAPCSPHTHTHTPHILGLLIRSFSKSIPRQGGRAMTQRNSYIESCCGCMTPAQDLDNITSSSSSLLSVAEKKYVSKDPVSCQTLQIIRHQWLSS